MTTIEQVPGFTPGNRLAGLSSLVVSVSLTVLVLYGLSWFVGPPPTPAAVRGQISEVLDFFPEPLEQVQYLVALVLAPALLFSFYCLFRIPAARLPIDRAAALERRLEVVVSAGLIGILAVGLSLNPGFIWGSVAWGPDAVGLRTGVKAVSVAAAFAVALLAAAVLLFPGRFPALQRARRPAEAAVKVLAFALVGLVGLFCVIGIGSITEGGVYLISFNAVFHGMSQVFLGRQIPNDINYLYGLFPHFLEPLFRVFGLSVLSFSLLMGLLNMAALTLLWPLLRLLVSRVLLAGLTLIAIVYACYFDGRQGHDHYFQYFPIRFIFPALSLFLASRYFLRGGALPYYASFVVGSAAVLWNPDSGVVVLLAWLMALVFQELVARNPKQAARHLLVGAGVFAATVGAFSLAMFVRYGHAPDYLSAFYYQKLFSMNGFGLLPMVPIHPWNVVALIYAAGLLYAGMHLAEGRLNPRGVCVFHLSVLGAGLFSYFQGRSVNGTLACVSYPAFILVAFFADKLIEDSQGRLRAGPLALVGVFLFALSLSAVGMARISPMIVGAILDHGRAIVSTAETPVTRNARFIKERTHQGEEVLILSYLSGVYHLESGTLSPRGVKALVDMRANLDQSIKFNLAKLRTVPKIFLGSEWQLQTVRDLMLKEFKLEAATPDGGMGFLTPRAPSGDWWSR